MLKPMVTQIVPRLPPAIDGIGDYALNLARQLRKDFGLKTSFVTGDSTQASATHIEGFSVNYVSERSAKGLLSILSQCSSVVLLHYVGYGYAKRGCPFWLVDGLQRWRNTDANRLLVTMFHELYASGPLWASSFWLSPLQKNLAIRLAQRSDRCLTSRQGYAKILHQLSRGKQTAIPTLPVFSNIGEPDQLPPLAERIRRLVVFGGRSNRMRVYRESRSELELVCYLLGIEEIWDIGPPIGVSLPSIEGVPVMEKGQLSNTEISDILINSLAGFFNYPTDYLAKSTIFAAYCAHRLLPVSPRYDAPADGVEAGKHYWTPKLGSNNSVKVQVIADNAYAWYQNHNLFIQANLFAAQLTDDKTHED